MCYFYIWNQWIWSTFIVLHTSLNFLPLDTWFLDFKLSIQEVKYTELISILSYFYHKLHPKILHLFPAAFWSCSKTQFSRYLQEKMHPYY